MVRRDASNPAALLSRLDSDAFRVVRPANSIFLCGGPLASDADAPPSARAQIFSALEAEGLSGGVILAEKAQDFFQKRYYDDLISFEADIATLCTTILLVAESAGSIAELGAFSIHDSYKTKMRVLVEDDHVDRSSFIMLGPVRYLETINERDTIFFAAPQPTAAGAPPPGWLREVVDLVKQDYDAQYKTERFAADDPFHIMMSIIFLCWVHLAATRAEVVRGLYLFGVDLDPIRVDQLLYTLCFVGLVRERRVGSKRYFAAATRKVTMSFRLGEDEDAALADKLRLRATVSNFYRAQNDLSRLEAAGRPAAA